MRRTVEFENEVYDTGGVFGVEIAGWFVGKQDFRAVGKSPGDTNALLFAAGKLRRVVVQAAAEPHFFEPAPGSFFSARFAAQFERHHHIFQCSQRRDQLEILENEPDKTVAHFGALVFRQVVQQYVVQGNRAAGSAVESGAEAQQGCFSRPGRTDNRKGVACTQFERHIVEYGQGVVFIRRPVLFGEAGDFQHGYRFFCNSQTQARRNRFKKTDWRRNCTDQWPDLETSNEYPAKNPASHPMTLSHRMTCRVFSRIFNLIFTEH